MSAQDYAYWYAALKGEFGPVHENEPHCGYWRKRLKSGGAYVPAAIWPDPETGKLVAVVDGRQVDPGEIWTYVCQNPVTHAAYTARTETGRWPDEAPELQEVDAFGLPPLNHNQGPQDEAEILKGQIEAAAANIGGYADIADDTRASQAQSLRARLNELAREADTKRETEKRPHFEAAKAVDTKWQPMVKAAKTAADALGKALSAYLTRKHNEAEAARRAAEAQSVPAPEPIPTKVRGAYGRAASVRAVKVAKITDYTAVWEYFKRHPEIVAVIERLAQQSARDGVTVPGMMIETERKVA